MQDCAPTLRAGGHSDSHANAGVMPAVAFNWQGGGTQTTLGYDPSAMTAGTLVKDQTQAVALQDVRALDKAQNGGGWNADGAAYTLDTAAVQGVATSMQVRRLTPRECASLQGFPDDYLDITYRGKPAADGNKYRALGNSWAIPCVRWIGERIEQVEAIHAARKVAA